MLKFTIITDESPQSITEAFESLFNNTPDGNQKKDSEEVSASGCSASGCHPIPTNPKDHKCEEGMTEIGGWMICKHCGDNMRQIK